MERVKIRSHVGTDGVLQIVMPTQLQNTEVEVTVVVQPVKSESENYDLSSQKEPPKNIQQISEKFRQLRQSISSDNLSIREMIEEGANSFATHEKQVNAAAVTILYTKTIYAIMEKNSQPTQEPSILGKFASVVGLLGASLYFTGWIYRWAYYSFFQLEVTTLDLPVESFLLVPIQVLFGNIWAIGKTAIAFLLTALAIHLTLWLLQVLGSAVKQRLDRRIAINATKRQPKSWIARICKSLAEFSSLQLRAIQFLRSLLDETVIVAWVLIALFFLAKQQGFTDARRDAVNNTSTLPVVTFVASEGHLSVGRNPEDTGTTPSLQKYRFIGDLGLLESLQGQGYNDTLDPKNPKVWRLLMGRGGWIYLFRTLSATAASDERPLVLAIKEGDSGEPLMLLSPEYTKPRSK